MGAGPMRNRGCSMSTKKDTRPDVGASERAKTGAGLYGSTTSILNDITPAPAGQAVKIADFLSKGENHAVPLRHLRELLRLPARTVRLMIRQERLSGTPILENSRTGYYLPDRPDERDLCAKRLRHRAAQIVKVADAIAAADISGGDT